MGKSSGSLKRKKHSKTSSKTKASSKSKSRKHKSKKVRCREVSLSSSDYDDSKSMDTSVSSSSEDRYRRKRDRSRTRKDVKGRKKKAWRRSRSRVSNEDSINARKRKKAKRKNEYDEKTRDKSYRKKKIRREARDSSVSSGSRSCSTCHGGSAGIDDECKSSRGRSERKEKDKRSLRGRSGSENSGRYKARSCSPCSSPCSERSYEETEEKYVSENKSRRLRSVITTVTKEAEESNELCGNETNVEVVDDHDYPCRSNDSNDGGTKKELDHYTHPLSEEKLRVEDETGDINADLNFKELKNRDTSYSDRCSQKGSNVGTSESMKKERSDTSGANLNGNDLESILRQRALENLRKFRGVQPTAKASEQKNKIVSQVKQSVTDKEELVQGKSNDSNATVGTKFDKQTPVEETSLPVLKRNSVVRPRNNETILNMDKDISGFAKHQLACTPVKVIDADNPSGVVTESTNNKTVNLQLATSESCHDSLQSGLSLKQMAGSRLPPEKAVVAESTKEKGSFEAAHVTNHNSNDNSKDIRGMPSAVPKPSIHRPKFKHSNLNKGQDDANAHSHFEPKQTSDSDEPSDAKLPVTETDEEKNAAKTPQSAIQSINSSGRDVGKSCNAATLESCIKSSSVENNNSGKLQDASNQGSSQFEQKTMSVMRGGEMVQVSYKVYIPKKAPALARRQLKR